MADMSIDSLQVQITSSSAEAEKSLDNLTDSLKKSKTGLEGIDFKANGLVAFTNSLKRLGNVTKTYNPESLNKILDSIKNFATISANTTSMSGFVKNINSIIRSTEKKKSTTDVFPTLSSQLKNFFD